MKTLNRIWICSILFCAIIYLTNAQNCITQEKIDNVSAITTDVSVLISGLPTPINYTDPSHIAQYTDLLNTLCTTERPNLDYIETVYLTCSSVLGEVPPLFDLWIAEAQFIGFFIYYESIEEFCNCSQYLIAAWGVATMDPLLRLENNGSAPFSNYANLDTYCGSADFGILIDALDGGVPFCPILAFETYLHSQDNAIITETKKFIEDYCASYDTTKYFCAINASESADFISCLDNPPSILITDTGDVKQTRRCEARVCVSKYIGMACGVVGRDLYIYGVNLQRWTGDILIATEDCEGCTSTSLMAAWAVAAMESTLKTTNNTAPLSPTANLDIYCQNTSFISNVDTLYNGISTCAHLGTEAALVNNARINQTKKFLDKCSSFDTTKYSCAITASESADFTACLDNPPSNLITDTGDVNQTRRCETRVCVSKYIGMACGEVGRDLYIYAVNLQRWSGDNLIATEDCEGCTSTSLMAAWAVAAMESMLKTTNNTAPLSPTANLDIYCQTTSFISNVDTLYNGISTCAHLGTEAALVNNARINQTKEFLDKCSSFDTTQYECAMNVSLSSDFKDCMANLSNTAPSTMCGRRECVVKYIESSCEKSGRDYYIDAVNLPRAPGDHLIATKDCQSPSGSENGATIITMTTMTSLAIFLIHCFII